MNKLAIIIISLVLAMVVELVGCTTTSPPTETAPPGFTTPEASLTANPPTGPSVGKVNEALTYSTTTSTNMNIAGLPEYRFDWGDGSYSSWSSSPSASHSWTSAGSYTIRAQARHPGITSEWSSSKSVTITLPSSLPTSDAPASLPISASVDLTPYSKIDKPPDCPQSSSVTEDCIHMSSAVSLAEGQTITLTVDSDCPINWFGASSEGNPKPEVGILFARMESVGITSLGAEQVFFFNEGSAVQIVIKIKEDYIHRLIAFNHDPDNPHYLNYSISNGVASPPPNWTPSSPSPGALPRSPWNPEIMKYFITPDAPEVKAAVNDMLSGEWRWAYNDFNALREWVSTHVSYRSDQDVHGAIDYWQLPAETLELGTGDCEDFAILLCTLLRANGVPAEQVYVAVGVSEDNTYHAYLVEKWYKGVWRVIEPEWGALSGLFLMDWLTSTSFEERYCFNDEYYFTGAPSLPVGVYEFEVDYSFYFLTRGAWVTFERHLNAGEKVTGSLEWLADRGWSKENYQIVWDWSLYIYAPDGSTAFTWSGTDLQHNFSFTPTVSGIYKVEILKRDYLARCARLTIDPPDWKKR